MKPTFFLAGSLAVSLLAVSRAQTLDTDTLDTFLDRLAAKQKGMGSLDGRIGGLRRKAQWPPDQERFKRNGCIWQNYDDE